MRSVAKTLPITSPLIKTTPARTVALTTPFSPMIRLSLELISPLNLPFSMTVPLKVYLPSISEPSSMKAVRSLLLRLGSLLLRHRMSSPSRSRLPLTAELRGLEVVHQVDRLLAVGVLVHLRDVTVEDAALGDHERIGRDVAADAAGVGDLDVAGGDHVALIGALDDRVHRLHVGVDHAFLTDHELAADVHLAADLALDLDRVRDVELALHAGALADHREQRDRRGSGLPFGRRRQRVRLLGTLLVTEHRKTPCAVRPLG